MQKTIYARSFRGYRSPQTLRTKEISMGSNYLISNKSNKEPPRTKRVRLSVARPVSCHAAAPNSTTSVNIL